MLTIVPDDDDYTDRSLGRFLYRNSYDSGRLGSTVVSWQVLLDDSHIVLLFFSLSRVVLSESVAGEHVALLASC